MVPKCFWFLSNANNRILTHVQEYIVKLPLSSTSKFFPFLGCMALKMAIQPWSLLIGLWQNMCDGCSTLTLGSAKWESFDAHTKFVAMEMHHWVVGFSPIACYLILLVEWQFEGAIGDTLRFNYFYTHN